MTTIMNETLSGLMSGPRARGAFLLRSVLDPPWCMRIEDEAPLSLVSMIRGQAFITTADGQVHSLIPHEVAILRGPDPYQIGDSPSTPPQVVILPGQQCKTLAGSGMAGIDPDTRTWGGHNDGTAVMLSGTYQFQTEIGRRLLAALPSILIRQTAEEDALLISLLASEMKRTQPGQELVLDRVLDLLLVKVLRTWLASPDTDSPSWYRAQADPVVGQALRLMHDDPAHAWTVQSLAARCGISRAAMARRFTTMVGEPPINYLTGLRIALAADLLGEPELTVAAVAGRVGYGSAFALSTAFKRIQGVSPQEYRAAHRVVGPREASDTDELEELDVSRSAGR